MNFLEEDLLIPEGETISDEAFYFRVMARAKVSGADICAVFPTVFSEKELGICYQEGALIPTDKAYDSDLDPKTIVFRNEKYLVEDVFDLLLKYDFGLSEEAISEGHFHLFRLSDIAENARKKLEDSNLKRIAELRAALQKKTEEDREHQSEMRQAWAQNIKEVLPKKISLEALRAAVECVWGMTEDEAVAALKKQFGWPDWRIGYLRTIKNVKPGSAASSARRARKKNEKS